MLTPVGFAILVPFGTYRGDLLFAFISFLFPIKYILNSYLCLMVCLCDIVHPPIPAPFFLLRYKIWEQSGW